MLGLVNFVTGEATDDSDALSASKYSTYNELNETWMLPPYNSKGVLSA